FFREPDAHLGYITFNLSMGQILSLPMIIIGIILVLFFSNKYAKLS
ncbi:MAG: prolipoprotein diacylglyceryl transferase, partial [Gammaproteobacteria bacterium]|nr:prolipoprotein diacylglyceryl transferase [Gammaproteobacteria bacterium]